jgi:predicted transcriptional regulator
MANQPRPGNPARAVRVEDELWNEAKAIAAMRGDSLSDVMREALRRYVKRHRQAE